MGYKLWGTNELLTSADLNNYLMKQTIISCTSGTRPGGAPDGVYIYETDTRLFRSWNSVLGQWIVMGGNGLFTNTPTITATTSNPNLGSGAVRRGKYTRGPGGMVHYAFRISFGTSGSSAGSGQYLIDLPIAAAVDFGGSDPEWWGAGRVTDTTTTTYTASFYIPGSNPNVLVAVIGGGNWNNNTPFTSTNNDECAGTISYRAVAGS